MRLMESKDVRVGVLRCMRSECFVFFALLCFVLSPGAPGPGLENKRTLCAVKA